MDKLLELNQWDDDGVLRYSYTSTDVEYLEDKADRIYKIVNALNKVRKKYDVYMRYVAKDDSLEVTLHILIQTNEEYKCKENKDDKERDI